MYPEEQEPEELPEGAEERLQEPKVVAEQEAAGGAQLLPFQEVPETQEAVTVLVSYILLPLCSCRLNTV